MHFDEVVRTFAEYFEREEIPFALIGGLALQAWGHSRFTRDLDLLVPAVARSRVLAFTEGLGYETLFASDGFSNHLHSEERLGRVDFMYVDQRTSEQIFSGARPRLLLPDLEVPVPRPEHLIAMKLLAIKNNPARVFEEMTDIQHLVQLEGVDRGEVRDYFERFDLLRLYDELTRTI